MSTWISENWRGLAISGAVGIASWVVLLWAQRWVGRLLTRWLKRSATPALPQLLLELRPITIAWTLMLSAYLALQLAPGAPWLTALVARVLMSLLILSVVLVAIRVVRRAARQLGAQLGLPAQATRVAAGLVFGVLAFSGVLGVLELWGAPALPLLVVVALAVVVATLAARDVLPNAIAAIQLQARGGLHVQDYIRLDSGEEGTIEALSSQDVAIRTVDGSLQRIPLRKLARASLTNYGAAPRAAAEPLHFVVRSHLRELTGLSANDLRELADGLKAVPGSSIYYHTHQYIEEHQYLTPTPANAFAEWVQDALGHEGLAERLAAVEVLELPTLGAVRQQLLDILERAIADGVDNRRADAGKELHFLKSITFVTPCPFAARNLRELAGILRRLSAGSLYYHLFEARLLGGESAANDICTWLRKQLGQDALASEIARLNPYDYTLDGLRSTLVNMVEARV